MPRTMGKPWVKTDFSFPETVSFIIDLTIPKISTLTSKNTAISSEDIPVGLDSFWSVNLLTAKKVKMHGKEEDHIAVFMKQRLLRQDHEGSRTPIVMYTSSIHRKIIYFVTSYSYIRVDFSIVDPSTNRINPHFSIAKTCVLVVGESDTSAFVLFRHSDIWGPEGPEPKLALRDDTLKIRAEIRMGGSNLKFNCRTALLETLQEQCRAICDSNLGCDFVLVSSDGIERRVHKAFLSSASPVFHRMFESNLKECATGRCIVSDIDAETLETLLKFMYYGSVEVSPDHAKAVLVAADKYELEGLKEHCEEIMSGTIKTENVAEILLFADQMSATDLKQAALQYMAMNRDETLNSSETDAVFGSSDPKLVKEVFAAMLKSPPAKRNHDQVVELD